ncbi:MAG: amino acid adenylation domain-containing protein [Candidatus Binatia bacterium]
MGLAAAVHRAALATPAATALVVDGREYTYAQLAAAAAAVARRLGSSGPTPSAQQAHHPQQAGDARADGIRVGILATRSFETFAGLVGAAWAGATAVPLHPRQPAARLASILEGAGLRALVADETGAALLGDARVAALLPGLVITSVPESAGGAPHAPHEPAAAHDPDAPAPFAPARPAYVIHTSGTTGRPKGVVVTAANVAHFVRRMRDLYALTPEDRVGGFCEPSFDLSVFEIYSAFDAGAALHVVPADKLLAPAGFVRDHALTVWSSVPSVISILQRMKLLRPGLFPSLRVSVFIGEALSVAAARAWQEAAPNSVVDNHYGPTEATVACTVQRLAEPVAETPGRAVMSIGRPYAGMEVEAVDADGRFLADGETGELALHGPQVAAGYLGDEAVTARRFVHLDHPRLGLSRWYLTGDLGYRDAAGLLHCLGRVDHQVKINGHRVELEDLEAHLRLAAGCEEAAAIAWPFVDGHAAGTVAFVCGAAAPPEQIRERLRGLLPSYMLPRRVVVLDALPLTPNGKVDRKALAAALAARTASEE